jgi:hypothetical protein
MQIPAGTRRFVTPAFALLLTACTSASLFAAPFTAGNLVITRVGTGSTSLTANATAVFLDEYTTAGVLVQTISLPTAASGANVNYANSGTASSEGFLQRSPDGTTLSLIGYQQTLGSSVSSTSAATVKRVIATVDATGAVDTSTVINTGTIGVVRSVITDGSNAWFAADSAGVERVTLGAVGGATQISNTVSNTRVVSIANGQLYVSSGSGFFHGVSTVGAGEPTTTGQTTTVLPGFTTIASQSPYDYVFADQNTLYLADDSTSGPSGAGGGVQKWIFTPETGSWSLVYDISQIDGGPATTSFRALTGAVVDGQFHLYGLNTASKLYAINDTGTASTSSVTLLATAAANTAFRGVEFVPVAAAPVPEPASVALLSLGGVLLLRRRK